MVQTDTFARACDSRAEGERRRALATLWYDPVSRGCGISDTFTFAGYVVFLFSNVLLFIEIFELGSGRCSL